MPAEFGQGCGGYAPQFANRSLGEGGSGPEKTA
jgi:hypothetical protein